MKKIMFSLAMFVMYSSAFAQEQLSTWFSPPYQLSTSNFWVSGIQAASGNVTNGRGYNAVYDGPQVLFYVSQGKIYNGSTHTVMATLDDPTNLRYIGNEIGIVPYPDNFYNVGCSKKYTVIYSIKNVTSNPQAVDAQVCYVVVNMITGTVSTPTILLNATDRHTCPMAIGHMNPANGYERLVYLQGRVTALPAPAFNPADEGLQVFKLSASGTFTRIANYTGLFNGNASGIIMASPDGPEMELSNNGNTLAYTAGNYVEKVNLTNGLVTGGPGTPYFFTSGNIVKGLEFDATGNKVYYSCNGGVFVKDITLPAGTVGPAITGTSNYGFGQLEKSYTDSYYQQWIVCGNGGTTTSSPSVVALINPVTDQLSAGGTTTFQSNCMPDQIDGEYMDASLFSVSSPYFICKGHAGWFNVTYSPLLIGAFNLDIKNLNTGTPLTTLSYPNNYYVPPVQNTNIAYEFKLYNINTSTCSVIKTRAIHVFDCTTRSFKLYKDDLNNGTFSLRGVPDDENESDIPGFGDAWYVQEIDPETMDPHYTIEDANCWQMPDGSVNTFDGFDGLEEYQELETELGDCSMTGTFLPDRTYIISRATWSDTEPWNIYSIAVHNGEIMDDRSMFFAQNASVNITQPFKVYPNPSTGMVQIETNLTEDGTLEIYDMLGNVVFTKQAVKNQAIGQLDLSALSKGLYTIKIRTGQKILSKKIVLE